MFEMTNTQRFLFCLILDYPAVFPCRVIVQVKKCFNVDTKESKRQCDYCPGIASARLILDLFFGKKLVV
jgi:hypothetical protein